MELTATNAATIDPRQTIRDWGVLDLDQEDSDAETSDWYEYDSTE